MFQERTGATASRIGAMILRSELQEKLSERIGSGFLLFFASSFAWQIELSAVARKIEFLGFPRR